MNTQKSDKKEEKKNEMPNIGERTKQKAACNLATLLLASQRRLRLNNKKIK